MHKELKKEVSNHLIVSLALFVALEFLWLIKGKFSFLGAGGFFLGLFLGTFILDSDHLIYWFFLYPQLEESKKAKQFWQKKQWRELLALLSQTHKNHVSLIFHHFLFQTVLLVLTLFIFSSTISFFGKGLILAADTHLLMDEFIDFRQNVPHLQKWLFARTAFGELSLPSSWLRGYLYFNLVILGILVSLFLI